VEWGGEEDDYGCRITFQRSDDPKPASTLYTVADAKRARLWGKSGPWTEHPDAMLQWRCVSRMADFYFPDIMAGLGVMEVAREYSRGTATVEREKPTAPDPLLVEAGEPDDGPEVDPSTGEVIPDYVGPRGDE
jgi:hypothetical protein